MRSSQGTGSQGNLGEAIAVIILGILGGMALAALLEQFTRTRCPVCQNQIQRGLSPCPYCLSPLRWG